MSVRKAPRPCTRGERGWGEGGGLLALGCASALRAIQSPHPQPLSPKYGGEGGVLSSILRFGIWVFSSNRESLMQLGMIGLGRMGANMVRRLLKGGHQCVVFDRSPQAVTELAREK